MLSFCRQQPKNIGEASTDVQRARKRRKEEKKEEKNNETFKQVATNQVNVKKRRIVIV